MNSQSQGIAKDNDRLKEVAVDLQEFEHAHNGMYNELNMKTNIIEKLQKDLDAANMRTLETNISLDGAKNKIQELEYSLKAAVKKSHFFENKLKEKSDSINNSMLRYDLAVTEKEALQKMVECAEKEKYELTRKVADLTNQHEYEKAFKSDLWDQDTKIRGLVSELKNAMSKLELEQAQVLKLTQTDKDQDKLLKSVEYYKTEVHKLKKSNAHLEEELSYTKAKFNKLVQILGNYSTDSVSNFILKKWQLSFDHHKSEMKMKNETIDKLVASLKAENKANKQLIAYDRKNNDYIEELEQTVSLLKSKGDMCDAEVQTDESKCNIKCEIIEIIDD